MRIVACQDAHEMKVCSKCAVRKKVAEFNRDKSTVDGLRIACRTCTKKAYKDWYNSEQGNIKKREYDQNRDKEYLRKKGKKWRAENLEQHRLSVKRWAARNPDKIKAKERRRPSRAAWYRKKRKEDVNYRLSCALRTRLNSAVRAQLRGSYVKQGSAIENLGCSMGEFIIHIENLFKDAMSWENYGDWHLDHIRPLSGFVLMEPDQLAQACHFTNLQPLWAADNIRKGNCVISKHDQQNEEG